ncbi:MAG: hypothetical protein ACREVL_09770 [Solimonas sp.]
MSDPTTTYGFLTEAHNCFMAVIDHSYHPLCMLREPDNPRAKWVVIPKVEGKKLTYMIWNLSIGPEFMLQGSYRFEQFILEMEVADAANPAQHWLPSKPLVSSNQHFTCMQTLAGQTVAFSLGEQPGMDPPYVPTIEIAKSGDLKQMWTVYENPA